MIEYKSRYLSKSRSVYGEPSISFINTIIKYTGLSKDSKILIPNCNDGIYVLPLLARGYKNITCYEENEALLNGGIIDNFYTIGLVKRISKYENNVNIIKQNYYQDSAKLKYDLILVIRTLQLKVNNKYSIEYKINKLKQSVSDNGYLFIKYYLNEDNELLKKQVINKNKICIFFDKSEWNILHYRENDNRLTKHNKHPLNRKTHFHNVGYILVQKCPYKYNKRNMLRTYKKASIYGQAGRRIYSFISLIKKQYQNNANVLIIFANDGRCAIPFLKNGFNVTCYEENNILINGGEINNKKTLGLIKRIKDYELSKNATIKISNFFANKERKKYDVIYIDSIVNLYEKNIKKILFTLCKGGYLYISYNVNSYDRKKSLNEQIKSIINPNEYNIVYVKEINNIGYILIRKKSSKKMDNIYYKILVS